MSPVAAIAATPEGAPRRDPGSRIAGRLADVPAPAFALALALVVMVLTAPRLYLHELWRDEAWLWIVATQNASLSSLVETLGRSGQGYLFPMLAWLAARVTDSHHAMQALNLVIVAAGVYVLARFAPLRRLEVVLIAFGYYAAYEYAVLSRHYALGMTLGFIACAAARDRRSPLLLGAALGLMCQTTVYAFILAIVIAAGAVWLARTSPREGASRVRVHAGIALALAGATAGLVQLMPAEGTPFAGGWRFHWDPAVALEALHLPWRGLLPLPRLQVESWNSDLLAAWPMARAAAGIVALLLALALLWPRKFALGLFAIGAAGLLAFAYVKYVGTMRHHGHLWLVFVASIWLAGGLGPREAARSVRERLLLGVLWLHAAAAAFVSTIDLLHPFSNGERTAALLRTPAYAGMPLLGYREPPAASVSMYLGQPLYAPSRQRYATHTDWGPLQRDLSPQELRCSARALVRAEARDVLLVMNAPLPAWPEIDLADAVTGAMVPSENYLLYRMPLARLDATRGDAGCAGEA